MNLISLATCFTLIVLGLSSCNALPQLYQTAEDIADDTAIKVLISKETFQKDTDLDISINVQNKDKPKENDVR
jgi:hypothetical protein